MTGCGCSTGSCTAHSTLKRHGIKLRNSDFVVALAGNPNTGKSTVFNALTGLRQHTGNWPGKTVSRAEGMIEYQKKRYKLIDLPGTYSLFSMSQEEEITRDYLLFGKPDVTVVVLDSTNIERNLNFALQVLEITGKTIICLNLMDEAKRKGIVIDVRKLETMLGVPVIPTSARYKKGLGELVKAVSGVAGGSIKTEPRVLKNTDEVEDALNVLSPLIEQTIPGVSNSRWIALKFLDGENAMLDSAMNGS